MPRPRPPYLQRERTRHGETVWYVRRGDGPRIRIRGEYGSPEFNAAYEAAVAGKTPTGRKVSSQSLEWLIARYKESAAWYVLSLATQEQRDNIYKNVLQGAADVSYASITRAKIAEGRDRRRETPNQANNFIKSMRGLFAWAVDRGYLDENPAASVKLITVKTDGYHVWTEEEVAAFEAKYPRGTRERVWLDVLLYTGLRRGDAVRLGPANVRGGRFRIVTEKGKVEVDAPVIAPLAETLAAGPVGKATFICGARGEALTKESFGNYFRRACEAVGVPGAAHGLRKAGATRAAEAGATHAQLRAMFGWTDDNMPLRYTRSADRARLATDVADSLSKVRGSPEKRK